MIETSLKERERILETVKTSKEILEAKLLEELTKQYDKKI